MLWVNWTKVDTIHLKGNRFVIGVKIKAMVVSKCTNDCTEYRNQSTRSLSTKQCSELRKVEILI